MTGLIAPLSLIVALSQLVTVLSCKCYIAPEEPVQTVIKSAQPHTYLKASDLPVRWDWRNVNGTNYCSKVMTQQSPNVCGSCWAEAATGAISDRYTIATDGKLRVQMAPQQLLNFNKRLTGGSCNGGSDLKAYEFMHKFGIADDTCDVFVGLDWVHGFFLGGMTKAEEIRRHQCYACNWDGSCTFVPKDNYDVYGTDEFGSVKGVEQMKAEIYARGPISCLINSDANVFDKYHGGVITCEGSTEKECENKMTDHVIVLAGWGVDEVTKMTYWVGRNSYGTRWGEGAGGGWFRIESGKNTLGIESDCSWATPAQAHVERAVKQYNDALGLQN